MFLYNSVYASVSVCMCVQLCSDRAQGGESRGGPLWVFVWLRLSSSLGKWKLNTPLQRSGYQVREEERKGEKQSEGRERCIGVGRGTEKKKKGEARERKTVRFRGMRAGN